MSIIKLPEFEVLLSVANVDPLPFGIKSIGADLEWTDSKQGQGVSGRL